MTKQFKSRLKGFDPTDEANWSDWQDLLEYEEFNPSFIYRFRDKPEVKLPDGVYAYLDDRGLPRTAIWRREDGHWTYAESGFWRTLREYAPTDESIKNAGFARLKGATK